MIVSKKQIGGILILSMIILSIQGCGQKTMAATRTDNIDLELGIPDMQLYTDEERKLQDTIKKLSQYPNDFEQLKNYADIYVIKGGSAEHGQWQYDSFYNDVMEGTPSKIVIAQFTQEKDAILTYLEYNGNNIYAVVDRSRDSFDQYETKYDEMTYLNIKEFDKTGEDGEEDRSIYLTQDSNLTYEQIQTAMAENQARKSVDFYCVANVNLFPGYADLTESETEQLSVMASASDTWRFHEGDTILSDGYFAVYDLDGDGKLELISTMTTGLDWVSENHFYISDTKNSLVCELPQTGENGKYELNLYDEINAYVDNKTGIIYYCATDYERKTDSIHDETDGVFWLKKNTVYDKNIRYWHSINNGTSEEISEYYGFNEDGSINEDEVSKAQWDMFYDNFASGMTKKTVILNWVTFDEEDFASTETILKKLIISYKGRK